MASEQLSLLSEEPKVESSVYYNGLGEPLPWEEEQAKSEGWIDKGGE